MTSLSRRQQEMLRAAKNERRMGAALAILGLLLVVALAIGSLALMFSPIFE